MSNLKFYNQVACRVCKLLIKYCQCKPTPCPFCDREFGFINDWNMHLWKKHRIKVEVETD